MNHINKNKKIRMNYFIVFIIIIFVISSCYSKDGKNASLQIIKEAYPYITDGILSYAKLGNLKKNSVMKYKNIVIMQDDIDKEIKKSDEEIKNQLKKYSFFLLEELALQKLIVPVAKKILLKQKNDISKLNDSEIMQEYFQMLTKDFKTDDKEIGVFYEQNIPLFGGAKFDDVKNQIEDYLLNDKKQKFVMNYINEYGKDKNIEISSDWVKKQYEIELDNSVDKARKSGMPSVVDFGSTGCEACDLMAPVLNDLKTKYAGKVNVVVVQVKEEEILSYRFGIESIPTQIFYDKDGKETYRNTGFYPKQEIEKKLKEIGAEYFFLKN